MTPERLYQKADQSLLPTLRPLGFDREHPGEFRRRVLEGVDRILISHGPGAKRSTHFCVGMEYRPKYMNILDEIIPLENEDEGFLVGPYLNPVAVTPRPKYWGY